MSDCKIDGETITCLDTYADEGLKSMDVDFIEGSWVAVVRDRKIRSYAFTASPESLAKLAPPPSESAPTTPAILVDFPIGNYSNTILAWTWDFKADGSYSAGGPQVGEVGTFTVTGDQISVKGSYCGDATGIYTWSYDGTALEFEQVHDECLERAGTVVTGKWVERP